MSRWLDLLTPCHGPIAPRLRKSCEIVRENEESCESCDFFVNNEKLRKKWRASLGKGYPEAAMVIKRLGHGLATKRNAAYSRVLAGLRCCLASSLAKSVIRCVRGSRSVHRCHFNLAPIDLVQARLAPHWTVFTAIFLLSACCVITIRRVFTAKLPGACLPP